MPNVFELIFEWSRNLSDWQSDAVRRLLIRPELSDEDVGEILVLLKVSHGLTEASEVQIPARRLAEKDFSAPDDHSEKVLLVSMHDNKNVNALTDDQVLTFKEDGLTLIYGDNAAGKSGYSRVLKKACRSREEEEKVYPNLLDVSRKDAKPEALFDVTIAGIPSTVKWVSGEEAPEQLAQIAVFDDKCVRVYLDQENTPVYLPYGLDVFPKLAELCNILKSQCKEEMQLIDLHLQILDENEMNTAVGQLLLSLDTDSKTDEIDALSDISGEDNKRLEEGEKKLREIETTDPLKRAEEIRRKKSRLERLSSILVRLRESLGDKSIQALKTRQEAVKSADTAVRLAFEEEFKNEPLAGIGTDPWKLMFESARNYSENEAYPGQEFPVLSDDSRCVLCHQILSLEASDRLRRFEDFVKRDLETKAKAARTSFEASMKQIGEANSLFEQIEDDVIAETREIDQGLADGIIAFVESGKERILLAVSASEGGPWPQMPPLVESAIDTLSTAILYQEKFACEYEALGKAENKTKLQSTVLELRARKILAKNKRAVKDHIEKLKRMKRYEECIAECNTGSISKKHMEVSGEVITQTLKTAIESELLAIGVIGINLDLKKRAEIGEIKIQLQLSDCYTKTDLSGILSEGEQRAVAIAAFLAELQVSSRQCGIIFDDPVSSLDHNYRERIANRLVAEAMKRQVVVFTHDIYFFYALKDKASIEGVPIATHVIRRDKDCIGLCDTDRLWQLESTNNRLKELRRLAQDARSLHKEGSQMEYETFIRRCYSLLRATWERAVEDALLNEVIIRFRPSIETNRLKCVTIEDEDFRDVRRGMTRASGILEAHDEAGAVKNPVPSPNEFEEDVEKLEEFRKRVTIRRDSVGSRRA